MWESQHLSGVTRGTGWPGAHSPARRLANTRSRSRYTPGYARGGPGPASVAQPGKRCEGTISLQIGRKPRACRASGVMHSRGAKRPIRGLNTPANQGVTPECGSPAAHHLIAPDARGTKRGSTERRGRSGHTSPTTPVPDATAPAAAKPGSGLGATSGGPELFASWVTSDGAVTGSGTGSTGGRSGCPRKNLSNASACRVGSLRSRLHPSTGAAYPARSGRLLSFSDPLEILLV